MIPVRHRNHVVLVFPVFALLPYLFFGQSKTTVSQFALDRTRAGHYAIGAPKGNSLRLISWNIDRGYGSDKVVAALIAQTPDLCLLQEVDLNDKRTGNRDVTQQIAKSLGYDYAFGIEFQELSQGAENEPAYHGQATLSRWPILHSRVIRFKRQSLWWKPRGVIPNLPLFQRRLGGRIALVTELRVNGQMVVIYNLHLESRSAGRIQGKQLDEVLTDLKQYPQGISVIIGGDLNSKYNPTSVRKHLEAEGFHSVLGNKLVRTHKIIGYLDWMFYRGSWQFQHGEVLRGTHASDHDAITAQFGLGLSHD